MEDNKNETQKSSAPTDNQIYGVPANHFSPSQLAYFRSSVASQRMTAVPPVGAKLRHHGAWLGALEGGLWGAFIGDAHAMPVHWYYDRRTLRQNYGHVEELEPSQPTSEHPHPDSWRYYSQINTADEPFDLFHDLACHYERPGLHYHQFLQAGENTLNLRLAELLMRSLVEHEGAYDLADYYVGKYLRFLLTPGTHSDTFIVRLLWPLPPNSPFPFPSECEVWNRL